MSDRSSDRGPPDALQNRFHSERANKERQWQLVFTKYTVNPLQPGEAPGNWRKAREARQAVRGAGRAKAGPQRSAARQGQAAAPKHGSSGQREG